MATPTRWLPGLVLNGLALALALCSVPALLVPVMKLSIAGALMSPLVALPVLLLAVAVIDVGPVVGLVLAWRGSRGVPVTTAILSVVGYGALLALLSATGQHPFVEPGREQGPRPENCRPAVADRGAAINRSCREDAGAPSAADCPDGYFCLVPVQGRPELVCRLYCRNDCECPDNFECRYSFCEPAR